MSKRAGASTCSCTSGVPYRACCQRFHEGEEPEDPETLVRARFSAFALGLGAFVIRTAHPDHPQRQASEREISKLRARLRYQRLTIHDSRIDGDHASVVFTAAVFEKGRDRSFVERSSFERIDGGWRYLDGVTSAPTEPIPSLS